MRDPEHVYAAWIEPRGFGCKQCGYTSSNRRVVEQHLRQNHPDLFDSDAVPATAAQTSHAAAAGTTPANSRAGTAAQSSPPPSSNGAPTGGNARPAGAATAMSAPGHPLSGVTLYTDAGTWENGTKRQRSVFAVWDSRTGTIVVHEELPGTTNNEAEYAGIIAALELARHEGLRGVLIRSDSQLCVRQILGQYQVKEERLRPLRDRAARLLAEVGGRIEWVPREINHAGIFLERTYKR